MKKSARKDLVEKLNRYSCCQLADVFYNFCPPPEMIDFLAAHTKEELIDGITEYMPTEKVSGILIGYLEERKKGGERHGK